VTRPCPRIHSRHLAFCPCHTKCLMTFSHAPVSIQTSPRVTYHRALSFCRHATPLPCTCLALSFSSLVPQVPPALAACPPSPDVQDLPRTPPHAAPHLSVSSVLCKPNLPWILGPSALLPLSAIYQPYSFTNTTDFFTTTSPVLFPTMWPNFGVNNVVSFEGGEIVALLRRFWVLH
jgi:hypothetical protein